MMGLTRWRQTPVVALLFLLAACRVSLASAAAVADEITLKSSGRDPSVPPDDLNVDDWSTRIVDSPDFQARARIEDEDDGSIDAGHKASSSVEKSVLLTPFITPSLLISGQKSKSRGILTKIRTRDAKLNSKIRDKGIRLTSSTDARIPGATEASRDSIDGHGASAPSLAPRDASYQRRATAGHANAALATSERDPSSASSVLPLPTDSDMSLGRNPPVDYEASSLNGLDSPNRSEMPSGDKSSISLGHELRSDLGRREKDSDGKPSVFAQRVDGLSKKILSVRKNRVGRESIGSANDITLERDKPDAVKIKSKVSRVTNSKEKELSSPAILSSVSSDSNVKAHKKDETHLGEEFVASGSDAEVKSNIVKRSASDSPGIENSSNLSDQEGPTGHVMHRGIMENFAGDFTSPVDFQFADDYFNHEPYHYDIYYDDSMNSDFTNDEDFTLGEMEKQGSTSHSSVQSFPWEHEIGGDDATEDVHDNFEEVENTLELRLLGPDFQSELGYVLERLANDSQQRNRRHQVPVRHHDPRYSEGIAVGVAEGTCPPPVHSSPPGLCSAPPCTSHMMCYPQKMCCYNGCTYTCTEPVQPPPVVDWLEDSDIRLPVLDPLNPALPLRFESSPLSYGTGGGETVRLPGGCSLSAAKYEELKQFMTAESIQDCLCSGGEVVCVVKSSPNN